MEWMTAIDEPSERALAERYREIDVLLTRDASEPAWRAGFERWDGVRRSWKSWANATRLRYTQDTRREDYRDAQRELDRRAPSVAKLDSIVKRRLLADDLRAPLRAELGGQALALWDADLGTFDDAIATDLVRESALTREYTELLANATVTFRGEERTLAGIGPFLSDADRATRHEAERARWVAYDDRAERLDAIFNDLVGLRDGMARRLGYATFRELGYCRMRRVDYGPDEVARYRDAVATHVVPLAASLVRRFGAELGLDRVRFWDESVLGTRSRIVPRGDAAWIVDRSVEGLAAIDPSLGEFATLMREGGLLDVVNRPGKAVGAYCTNFPTRGVPFVFANFNGTRGDVRTLMHEFGHAFQAWRSRGKPAVDYLTPTLETAEIHSMALEYLSWPEMERFFGDDADAYRREHLLDALLFLPYGVAVDHFQHLVYAHPSATPAERHAMWAEMERRYLPWRDYGDLAFPARGALWQEKRHIYVSPFYYIDYTLALCCALQFWQRASEDRREALDAYVALCGRGGEAPFGELVRSAGLRSPFEAGVLEEVVAGVADAF